MLSVKSDSVSPEAEHRLNLRLHGTQKKPVDAVEQLKHFPPYSAQVQRFILW